MIELRSLIRDPVFQLNTILWSIIKSPYHGAQINTKPVLRSMGYRLFAIDKEILLPSYPGFENAIRPLIRRRLDPPVPDLWLEHIDNQLDLIIELKASSFGPESDKTVQMTKIISASADLSLSLGGGPTRPGQVIVVTVSEDMEKMAVTLHTIRERLAERQLEHAPIGVLGLQASDNTVALVSPEPDQLPSPMRNEFDKPVTILQCDHLDEIIPIYIIPWLPGVESARNDIQNQDSMRELTSRLLTHTSAIIGRSTIPNIIEIKGESLLVDSTLEVFRFWQDGAKRKFVSEATTIVKRKIKRGKLKKGGTVLEITLQDEQERNEILRRIERVRTGDPQTNLLKATKPTLFDDIAE